MGDQRSAGRKGSGSESDRLRAATQEARDDAAPFALVAAGLLVFLALMSLHSDWRLLGSSLWWIWLVIAAPYLCLASTLLFGVGRLIRHDRRRGARDRSLGVRLGLNLVGVGVLVVSLVAHSGLHVTGRQLLVSGGVVWFTDAVAFGLAFWELDGGGRSAFDRDGPRKPDFQFPQDESAPRPRRVGSPALGLLLRLLDELDRVQPHRRDAATRPAKALMAAESMLAAVTLLLIAARAVNILA